MSAGSGHDSESIILFSNVLSIFGKLVKREGMWDIQTFIFEISLHCSEQFLFLLH